MKNKSNIKVIIIGTDHHNTLAVIRAFGKEKIEFEVLIHGNFDDINQIDVYHSKYVSELYFVASTEDSILNYLLNKNDNEKKILFSCSDLAAYTIDKNYDLLKKKYFFSGFDNKPGLVCKLMDKYEQKRWAEENKILMAKTWHINKVNNNFLIPNDMIYPCIVKPELSAYGSKSDIEVCENYEELSNVLHDLSNRYSIILIQEYLKKNYEVCAFGCITDSFYGGIVRKIREYPFIGGSLTFAKFIDDKEIFCFIEEILKKLRSEGYSGHYDIELFVCNNEIYLNEINFRHSGNGYSLLKNGINSPYIWYNYMIGSKKIENNELKKRNMHLLDELNELHLLKANGISVITFVKDFLKASAYAKMSIRDFKYSIHYFFKKIKK